jgi:hypothetical protein
MFTIRLKLNFFALLYGQKRAADINKSCFKRFFLHSNDIAQFSMQWLIIWRAKSPKYSEIFHDISKYSKKFQITPNYSIASLTVATDEQLS